MLSVASEASGDCLTLIGGEQAPAGLRERRAACLHAAVGVGSGHSGVAGGGVGCLVGVGPVGTGIGTTHDGAGDGNGKLQPPSLGAGGGASGGDTLACSDGEVAKSNRSVRSAAPASRAVRCWPGVKRFSMSRRSEVWSLTTCDTYCGLAKGETAMSGMRKPSWVKSAGSSFASSIDTSSACVSALVEQFTPAPGVIDRGGSERSAHAPGGMESGAATRGVAT